MAEPLMENSQQNIPVNPSEQGNYANNAQYTGNEQMQQIDPNYQNQPYTPSNELGPMYKENPDNVLPVPSGVSYSYPCIFSIYLVQSLIYIGLFLFGFGFQILGNNGDITHHAGLFNPDILQWIYGIYLILSLVLFVIVRKYMEDYDNAGCGVFLFILFFVFKLCFFFLLCVSFIDTKTNISGFTSTLFYSNCAAGAIYIGLLIYSCIKKDISLLVSFGISILIAAIFFVSLFFANNKELAVFVIIFVLIEIVFLFIPMLIAKKTDILEVDRPLHNTLMIDYYKFFIIMLLSYLIVLLCLLMLYCACLCVSGCGSKATYSDDKGNIFDQYGRSMGIKLRKKPHSVGADGKFYDKYGNEISEDTGCQIF